MKKLILVGLVMGLFFLIANFVFSSNDFKEVPVRLEVSADDNVREAVIIEDKQAIEKFVQSINKARHENGSYEVSRSEDYQVKMIYQDGNTDILRLWLDFGEGFDMFRTDKTAGHYRLKNEDARETVREILN